MSIGVVKSNVVAPPRKLVAEKASAIYKLPFLSPLYNPERIKDFSERFVLQGISLKKRKLTIWSNNSHDELKRQFREELKKFHISPYSPKILHISPHFA